MTGPLVIPAKDAEFAIRLLREAARGLGEKSRAGAESILRKVGQWHDREIHPDPEVGCSPACSGYLPTWDEMTDLDKGAALMHLHKREYEGGDYAVENYPAEYHDHPALVALSPWYASGHAAGLEDEAERLDSTEDERLYELALWADRG